MTSGRATVIVARSRSPCFEPSSPATSELIGRVEIELPCKCAKKFQKSTGKRPSSPSVDAAWDRRAARAIIRRSGSYRRTSSAAASCSPFLTRCTSDLKSSTPLMNFGLNRMETTKSCQQTPIREPETGDCTGFYRRSPCATRVIACLSTWAATSAAPSLLPVYPLRGKGLACIAHPSKA